LNFFERAAIRAPVRAHLFTDALGGGRDVADDGHRLIRQRIDPETDASDKQPHRNAGTEGSRNAEPLQRVHKRCKSVADEDAENDRDEDRLRILENQDHGKGANNGQREIADDNDGLGFRNYLSCATVGVRGCDDNGTRLLRR